MSCKALGGPVANVNVRVTFAHEDVDGDELTNIKGANVYCLAPGASDYVKVGFAPYGVQYIQFPVYKDGVYAFICKTVIGAVLVGNNERHCDVEGPASEPFTVSVDGRPPKAPPKGFAVVACPTDSIACGHNAH